jgi:hypothetical protein
VTPSPGRLHVVVSLDEGGDDCDQPALLVMAIDEEHARLLYAAECYRLRHEVPAARWRVRVTLAEWQAGGEGPLPATRPGGIPFGAWFPGDAILVGYDLMPSEDYERCGCCGRIVDTETGWAMDGDDCDDCEADNASA